MDFLFLTAKVNKQLKIIHHNFSLHNTNKVNEKALHEETLILIGFCNLYLEEIIAGIPKITTKHEWNTS